MKFSLRDSALPEVITLCPKLKATPRLLQWLPFPSPAEESFLKLIHPNLPLASSYSLLKLLCVVVFLIKLAFPFPPLFLTFYWKSSNIYKIDKIYNKFSSTHHVSHHCFEYSRCSLTLPIHGTTSLFHFNDSVDVWW